MSELNKVAKQLVARGRGILAADESIGTATKRLEAIGLESTEELRRQYREMFFIAPEIGQYISGVIMFDETIRQKAGDGRPFAEVLISQGVIPGIKVDLGAKALALSGGEKVTEGLDGLRERLLEYKDMGAKFTKWRAVIEIGGSKPSEYCIHVNAHALARYAALAQEAGLVPIVEPEVLMDGEHPILRSFEVTKEVQKAVFKELSRQNIDLSGMLLKPNMVLSGYGAAKEATDDEVVEMTLKCLRETVPDTVPGVVFLSGGQSDEDATARLDLMNKSGNLPWELSFSYGRALQDKALRAWVGKQRNVVMAQEEFIKRAKLNALAREGKYEVSMEE